MVLKVFFFKEQAQLIECVSCSHHLTRQWGNKGATLKCWKIKCGESWMILNGSNGLLYSLSAGQIFHHIGKQLPCKQIAVPICFSMQKLSWSIPLNHILFIVSFFEAWRDSRWQHHLAGTYSWGWTLLLARNGNICSFASWCAVQLDLSTAMTCLKLAW